MNQMSEAIKRVQRKVTTANVEPIESKAVIVDRMAKARAAKAEKRGTAQTIERVRTKGDDVADQIEAIDDPTLQAAYVAAVTETLDGQSKGYSGLVPLWRLQKAGVKYDDVTALVEAGVIKAVVTEVAYIPVLLDKGAPEKKNKATTEHLTPDALVAALRKAS